MLTAQVRHPRRDRALVRAPTPWCHCRDGRQGGAPSALRGYRSAQHRVLGRGGAPLGARGGGQGGGETGLRRWQVFCLFIFYLHFFLFSLKSRL